MLTLMLPQERSEDPGDLVRGKLRRDPRPVHGFQYGDCKLSFIRSEREETPQIFRQCSKLARLKERL